MNTPFRIDGKVVLVTGAFGLIGKTLVKAFLEQGAKVAACDNNVNAQADARAYWQTFSEQKDFIICATDVTDAASCKQAVNDTVGAFGQIDVLINNAAIDAKFDSNADTSVNATRFEQFPIQHLQRSIDVNITGLVIITQEVIKQMMQQGFGNIINVASTYSLVAPNQQLYDFGNEEINYKPVDYVITKSMIPNFTKYLATFYADHNIRCNAIAPHGIFNGHSEAFVQNFSKLSPMGRMSRLDEITGPFLFLASDASSYMTGSVLTVDGGWTAW